MPAPCLRLNVFVSKAAGEGEPAISQNAIWRKHVILALLENELASSFSPGFSFQKNQNPWWYM